MATPDGARPAGRLRRLTGEGGPEPWARAGLVALALLSSSCVLSGGARGEALPPGPHIVTVAMDEYAFDFDAPDQPGRVELRARNVGDEAHELVLVEVPEDFPPMDEFVHDDTPQALQTVAKLPERASGERGTLAVDLAPGRYGLLCFVDGADGEKHALKGMHAEFTIPGATERDQPSPDHDHSGDDHEHADEPGPGDGPADGSGRDATSPSSPSADESERVQPVPGPGPSPDE